MAMADAAGRRDDVGADRRLDVDAGMTLVPERGRIEFDFNPRPRARGRLA